jgi:steroid delta-isomerase-like uncharacterized protein
MYLDPELAARREALVLHHMAVEEQGDAQAVVDTFTIKRYDLVATGQLLLGDEGVARRVRNLVARMPNIQIELVSLRHCEDPVIVETIARGTHTTLLFGIEPTGRPYSSRGIAIFRFEYDGLVEEVVYYDRLSIIEQLTRVPQTTPENDI